MRKIEKLENTRRRRDISRSYRLVPCYFLLFIVYLLFHVQRVFICQKFMVTVSSIVEQVWKLNWTWNMKYPIWQQNANAEADFSILRNSSKRVQNVHRGKTQFSYCSWLWTVTMLMTTQNIGNDFPLVSFTYFTTCVGWRTKKKQWKMMFTVHSELKQNKSLNNSLSFCPFAYPAQRKDGRIFFVCPEAANISWHTEFSIIGTCKWKDRKFEIDIWTRRNFWCFHEGRKKLELLIEIT